MNADTQITWHKSERWESPARDCTLITPSGIRYNLFSLATKYEDQDHVLFRITGNDTFLYEHAHNVEEYGSLPESEGRAIKNGVYHILQASVEHASLTAIMWCSHRATPYTITVDQQFDGNYGWTISWVERDLNVRKYWTSRAQLNTGWRSAMASAIVACMVG